MTEINAVEADLTRHKLVTTEDGEIVRAHGHIVVFDNIDNNMYCVLENEKNLRLFGLIPAALQRDTVSEMNVLSSDVLDSFIATCLPEAECKRSKTTQAINKEKVKWTKNTVLALITSWKANQPNFESSTIKNDVVWDIIAQDVKETGLTVTTIQTENKWKSIRKAYMAVKDHNSRSGNAPKTCSFYDELDEIFSKSPSVTSVALASSRTKRALTIVGKDCSSDDETRVSTSEEVETDSNKTETKSKKVKKSKLNRELEAWSKTLRKDADKRELAREKRHEAMIAVQNKGIAAFTDVMNKLIEKL